MKVERHSVFHANSRIKGKMSRRAKEHRSPMTRRTARNYKAYQAIFHQRSRCKEPWQAVG